MLGALECFAKAAGNHSWHGEAMRDFDVDLMIADAYGRNGFDRVAFLDLEVKGRLRAATTARRQRISSACWRC